MAEYVRTPAHPDFDDRDAAKVFRCAGCDAPDLLDGLNDGGKAIWWERVAVDGE